MSAWAHFALAALASGAEPAVSPLTTNPRYTGSPVVRTWLAEDYGASPVNTRVVQHPRTGCIYVSNERGVLEFDGVRWRLIPTPNQQIVTGLSVDGRGRIWGGGRSALFRLEPDERGELQARSMLDRLPANLRTGISVGDCVATAQGVFFRETRNLIFFGLDDGPARVWPATEGNAVTLSLWQIADEPYVNLGRGVVLRLRNDGLEPVPSIASRVLDTRATPDGAYQVLAPASLDRWDGTRRTVVHSPLGKDFAQNATFLADGRMVFATLNSGLIVCDREGRFLQKIDRTNGLPANNVNHVFEDREGGVWAALRYGIARVQLDSPYALHGPAQGREGTTLSLALSGGELFVAGTENAVRRRANGQFRPVQEARGPDREVIAHADRVYFLGLRLRSLRPALGNETTELEVRNYYGLVPVTNAPGWFAHGSNEGLRWANFADEKWVSEGPLKTRLGSATAVLEAPANVIWCTNLGVAWRIDFREGLRADAPTQRFSLAEGLPSPLAGMFLLGREVVAAGGGKLVRFNETTRRFEPETRVAGLDGFPIERAHRSPGGSVWLQGGPPTREIRRIVAETADQWRAARLPGEPLTRLLPTALLEDAALQTLWIGGHGALISRDLTWQPTRPAVAPTAVVRRIETAGGQMLTAGEAVSGATATPHEFAPEQNALRITFAAPIFNSDHHGIARTEYRTRLDGLDREWSAWSKHTERDFTNLPWRDFTFRVQARDAEGRIGPEGQVAFTVRPPWWASRGAWVAYGALGLLGFAGAVRLRTRVIHRQAERLEEIIASRTRELAASNDLLATSNAQLALSNAALARLRQLELDEKITAQLAEEKARLEVLRYQLNPHFLYNALNSIYGLLYENARDAGEMVLRLSEFCRSTLTGATEELPTLKVELAALQAYLDVEKVRWRDRLQIEFDVAPEVEAVQLPPFLLLPLAENAIKHGARTTPDRMRLRIRAFRLHAPVGAKPEAAPDAVVLEIINSGEWLPPEPNRPGSTGIGLENLRQRLRRYYPNAHAFTTEAQNGWVTVRVQISPSGLRTGGAAPVTETTAAS